MNSNFWIKHLNLNTHPEGGYFKETYRSESLINNSDGQERNVSTAIYFLLEGNQKSHLHKIKSDELWFFHEGEALEILVLKEGQLKSIILGKNILDGENLQAIVPAGAWFGARLKEKSSFALVSCTVAPGFDFKDFELAKKKELIEDFPQHKKIIEEMCLE